MRRKPLNPDSAQAEGVDYLLREFKALRTSTPAGTVAAASTGTGGPIEPTYLVAASDARDEIKAVADFVCDGVADQEEIIAVDEIFHVEGRGILQLSAGTFVVDDVIRPGNGGEQLWLRGAGMRQTTITTGATGPGKTLISLLHRSRISDMSITLRHTGWTGCVVAEAGTNDNPSRLEDLYVEADSSTADYAIALENYGQAYRCIVGSDTYGDGILIGGFYVVIESCSILDSVDNGIDCGSTYGTGSLIRNNYITYSDGRGIDFRGDDSIIAGNYVHNSGGAEDIYISGDGNLYGGNVGTVTAAGTNMTTFDNDGLVPSPLTTKGDLWGYDTADQRIAVSTDDYVLTADSAQGLGVKWAAPATAAADVVSSPPADPVQGEIMFDTTDDTVKVYAGSSWYTLATDGSPTVMLTAVGATVGIPQVTAAAT